MSRTPSVVVDDLDVTYRLYPGKRQTLRRLVAGHGRRKYRSIEAVKGVSFLARPGEAVGVVGHNGSGKSTLLRAMAGLLPATSGQILARKSPVLLGVGAALEKDLPGRDNVFLGGTALGLSRADIAERLDDIMGFAQLEEFADMPLRAYSAGMKARLQFAIATAVTPDILLIDEALAVGDAEFKERSEARMAEMMREAGTIFLVSHSTSIIRKVCTRALWLDHGNLLADGEPEEILERYRAHRRRGQQVSSTGD